MSSITADPPLAPAAEQPAPAPRRKPGPFMQGLAIVASLRVTVVLFVLSFLLVFLGTLAQIDYGIGTVTKGYFRSWIVFIPLQVFVQFGQKFFGVPHTASLPGSIPFPAGLTIGWLLMVNLLAAHAIRFKLSWRRAGIIILHAGIILLLLAEFVTYLAAVEGKMVIEEGETANTVFHSHGTELAVVDTSDPKVDRVTAVPARLLRHKGDKVSHDDLPFDMECVGWFVNSDVRDPKEGEENPATHGFGTDKVAVELGEVSGVAADQTVDMPSAYVKLTDKETGKEMGTWLFSSLWKPQKIKVGGKSYEVALRFKEGRRPFSLTLLEFRFDRYPGTERPLNFSSRVRLVDEEYGEDREVTIRMNEPLRHRGETFFQADWNKKTERGTVLQVVRNPGWQLPYWSCIIVSIGMIAHFGIVLGSFLQKRGA